MYFVTLRSALAQAYSSNLGGGAASGPERQSGNKENFYP